MYIVKISMLTVSSGQEIDPREITSTVKTANTWEVADKFNYTEQFNLNDSVNAAVVINQKVMPLAETNIEYTQSFKLIDQDMEINVRWPDNKYTSGYF